MKNSSYNKMITKLMLTGISETQYPMLANGPLTDSKSSGITKIATALIQEHSAYMAEEGPIIWDEIAKIKEYVEKRNSIDEKKMYNEEESQKLLKTTEDVQNILEHISVQEEKFIELTDIVNKNIYRAYDCGDVCTDLLGCSDCENSIKGDILEVLKKMDDNQYVIFESCVLEYLDEEKRLETEKEITRVSGGDRFNVRMKPYILPDKFYCLPFVMC